MTAFAGVVFHDDSAPLSRIEDALLAIIERRSDQTRPSVQHSPRAVIVQHGDRAPDSSGVLFAASARLHNRDDVAPAIGLRPHDGDAALIRRQLELHGDPGIARLLGAFAFAHWSEHTGRLTLARDCGGRRSVFFHVGNGFVAFASLLVDLLAIPGVPCDVDEEVLARFIAVDSRQGHRTVYRGIRRVPSRTIVEITRHDIHSRRYWSPRPHGPAPYSNFADYVARARELFDIAVKRCIGDSARVAISTSGGLDSSAIAATAARLRHPDVTCYTLLPTDDFAMTDDLRPGYYRDERSKVEALGRLHPSLRVRFIAPHTNHPRQVDSDYAFALGGTPLRNVGNIDWFAALEDTVRGDGHDVLLTGGWGNLGLTWAGTSPAELLQARRYGPFLRETISAAAGGRLPTPAAVMRLVSRTVRARYGGGANHAESRAATLLRPGALDAFGDATDWSRDALDGDIWWVGGDSPERRARFLFDRNQSGRDQEAARVEAMGYENCTPHLDRDLLEFCLAVPERYYRPSGISRGFARQVLADRLPPEIVNEQRRGLQVPNWFTFLDMRKAAIATCVARMEGSALAARLIDMPRLKQLVAEWPADQHDADRRSIDYMQGLNRAVHIGEFIAWVEGGNARR